MIDHRRICGNCRWLGAESVYDDADQTRGPTCRRHAPVATGGMMSAPRTLWPIVDLNDSCGDFEEHEVEF